MPPFTPGLELSDAFFTEVVQPLLATALPGLRYSAALIGPGSEVLGYDTERSTDHHWGPRLLLFLAGEEAAARRDAVDTALRAGLPVSFRGYSTNFGPPDAIGVRLPDMIAAGPVNHMIKITTVRSFTERYLGIDPRQPLDPVDWLTLSEQKLLSLVRGRGFFTTGLGRSGRSGGGSAITRATSGWRCWRRSGPASRRKKRSSAAAATWETNLAHALVAARLVRDLMRLCFLLERTYAPYAKWFGTAFRGLACGARLTPIFDAALAAATWREREAHLTPAYEIIAEMQNATGIAAPLPTAVSPFHDRPYRVIHGERFASAITEEIADPLLREVAAEIGSVNQLIDATDKLTKVAFCRRLRALYEAAPTPPDSVC